LERLKERKKTKRKNYAVVFGVVLIVVLIGVVFGHYIADIAAENQAKREIVKVPEPTVEIRDENADTEVSARVKLFVARLEDDVREYGHAVDYVVLPLNKVREMHIFLRDRKEYYKMTVERGSAVQAEDMERMIRYLDSKKINATYVDLRVEGKAFYK
jgi:NhaP-type Na+/H+ and K+/H+ antiporter